MSAMTRGFGLPFAIAMLAVACGGSGSAPDQSTAGDIPDNQVFVTYDSATGGYHLDVPEGWARSEQGANATFVSKLDGVRVELTPAQTAPTAATARTDQVAGLLANGRGVKVSDVKDVTLPGGPAVLVAYASDSEPDGVTGKQVRLEENVYYIFNAGRLAALTLWAPQGADNVDQWQRMASSFGWR